MPSVKIPKKSTSTDMTPFVDVAFLILSFFMLATKFKPPAPVQITTPHSVSADRLKEQDAVRIEFDTAGKVYFWITTKSPADEGIKKDLIQRVNQQKNLGLTDAEIQNFVNNTYIGVPFSQVKQLLSLSKEERTALKQPGIPVDSTNNELTFWVNNAIYAFAGHTVNYMIKGDNKAKYPAFKGVIDALKKNELFKYQLITDPEGAPVGTELYNRRLQGKNYTSEQ
jgi:biopolymer transport protein ExbD